MHDDLSQDERLVVAEVTERLWRSEAIPRPRLREHARGRLSDDDLAPYRPAAEAYYGPLRDPAWGAILSDLGARLGS